MDLLSSAFLGLLQGLTEFLPVSSSGHLVLAEALVSNYQEPGVLFEAFLHAGTLLAIVYYFRKKILNIKPDYLLYIAIGTIPAAFAGYFFSSQFESLFSAPRYVGLFLLVTGILNLFTDKKAEKKKLDKKRSFVVGIFQAFAILPGISRSGSTIFAGTRFGIKKEEAATFSFLLSVPAVLGANLLQFAKYKETLTGNAGNYIVGFIFSFIAGYFAIGLVLKGLRQRKFRYFGYYCIAMGILTFLLF